MSNAGTVLIVDDESGIREIITLTLNSMGIATLEAEDGRHALEMLESQHADVVCSDLMMPRMGGLNFLEEIRQRGLMMPVIFLTGYPSQESTLQALRLGAFDYLEKPFESSRLKQLVSEAMRVSLEMQKTGSIRTRSTGMTSKLDLEFAALQIQKLRTLRFDEEKANAASDEAYLKKLRDMFVIEVTPQLLFCDAAIRNMANPEDRSFELGYLFRVMQTVADVAEAIGAMKISEIARAAEQFYTTLRVTTKNVTDLMTELASDANKALHEAVNSIDDSGDATTSSDDVVLALRQAAEAIESMEIRTSA